MSTKKQTTTAQSLPSGDMGTSVARPRRKADSVVKGSLHKWEGTDYAEFHPVRGKDEPTREMLKQVGNSTFYKNLGKKESSYTLHVNVDGESHDPVAEIYEIMDVLTKEQRKTLPKLPEGTHITIPASSIFTLFPGSSIFTFLHFSIFTFSLMRAYALK